MPVHCVVRAAKPPTTEPMKRIYAIFFMLIGAFTITTSAQDVQFSQFYNSPLTLNPALTGKVGGMFRVALNYRNQWFNVADKPYITYSGSIDAPIPVRKDAIGIGVQIMNDQTNNGVYNHTQFMLNLAYHKALDKKGKHSLSLGFQAGYYFRDLNRNNLRFFNQFDGNDFNQSLPTGETEIGKRSSNFDMGVGLLMNSHFGKKINFYVGGSMYHIIQPKESFLDGSEYELRRKYIAHGGMEYQVHKVVRLLPSIIYLNQAKYNQLNLGLSLGFDMTSGVTLYAGGYFRMVDKLDGKFGKSDAGIFYAAFEYNVVRLGFSYDATVSNLNNVPKPTGAFEMSLIITGKPRVWDNRTLLFCPRF